MKNICPSLLALALLIIPITAWSQVSILDHIPVKVKGESKWRIANIGISMGGYSDSYGTMDKAEVLRMAENPATFNDISLSGYTLDAYDVVLSGANMGMYVEFHPFSPKRQDFHLGHTLRLGASINVGRELLVSYNNTTVEYEVHDDPYGYDMGNAYYMEDCPIYNYDYISYCLVENEVQLNASYMVSAQRKRWSLYGGGGINMGGTFNNFLMILSSDMRWDGLEGGARNSYYTRAYLTGGLGFQLSPKVNLNMEYQRGGGVLIVNGANNDGFQSYALQFGLKYRVMK